MTKFIGKTMTMTLGAVSIPCLQSVEFSEDVEQVNYQCPESDTAQTLTGFKNVTMSVNVLLDGGSTGKTTLDAIDVNDSGALVFLPQGSGAAKLKYDSTKGTVTQRNTSFSINGITAVSIELHLDDLTLSVTA